MERGHGGDRLSEAPPKGRPKFTRTPKTRTTNRGDSVTRGRSSRGPVLGRHRNVDRVVDVRRPRVCRPSACVLRAPTFDHKVDSGYLIKRRTHSPRGPDLPALHSPTTKGSPVWAREFICSVWTRWRGPCVRVTRTLRPTESSPGITDPSGPGRPVRVFSIPVVPHHQHGPVAYPVPFRRDVV